MTIKKLSKRKLELDKKIDSWVQTLASRNGDYKMMSGVDLISLKVVLGIVDKSIYDRTEGDEVE